MTSLCFRLCFLYGRKLAGPINGMDVHLVFISLATEYLTQSTLISIGTSQKLD